MLSQRSFTLYSWRMEKSFMVKIEIILRGSDVIRKELFFSKNWNKNMAFESCTVLYGCIRRWTDTQIQIPIIPTCVPGMRRRILHGWPSLNLVFPIGYMSECAQGEASRFPIHPTYMHKWAFESLNEVLRARGVVVSALELKGMDGRADSRSQVMKCAWGGLGVQWRVVLGLLGSFSRALCELVPPWHRKETTQLVSRDRRALK